LKIYNIPDIGNIEIRKHHNSNKLSIKLKHNSLPRVIIPKNATYNMGLLFAIEKKQWIIQHLKELKSKQKTPLYDIGFVLKTQTFNIYIKTYNGKNIKTVKENDNINILIPTNNDIKSFENQEKIKNILIEIFRFEAKKILIPRVSKLAKQYGFKYKSVYIKNLKSIWGSCSSINNINLNLHLVRLPEYLSDFIILHELCHTIHKNHGKQFYLLLNKIVDNNERLLNKELKKYITQL
jgi:predicted metal-dependent hydrolase